MRIVLAANPGLGHVLPLLPLALAARAAGHSVTFLGGSSLSPVVERHGFQLHRAGPPDLSAVIGRVRGAADQTGKRQAALIWSHGFAGVVAPDLARGLLELAGTFPPDLVVHDDSEQGTWIAAERLGVPHVALQVTAWRGAGVRLSERPLGELRDALGLPADPGLRRWHRNGYLVTRPTSLLDPADPVPSTAVEMRHVALDDAGVEPASGLPLRTPDTPRIALTLGTVLPGRAEAIRDLIVALRTLDVEIVAAVGPGDRAAALQAADGEPLVHVTGYVPMSRLLPTCDALIFHGGSGTMMAALGHAVPMVLLPAAADQHENAARCAAAGVGIALAPAERSPATVAGAARQVLASGLFGSAARTIRDDLHRMPPPEALVDRLRKLATAGPDGVLAQA
jgi:UDP:flavonoid glycosyltransferase YjiC (YdhE family)